MKNYYDEALILYAKKLIELIPFFKVDDLSVLSIEEIEEKIKNIISFYNVNPETLFNIIHLAGQVQNEISNQLELDVNFYIGLTQLSQFHKFIKETCLNI